MVTTFTAPNESDILVFDLTVYDTDGNESTDSVAKRIAWERINSSAANLV